MKFFLMIKTMNYMGSKRRIVKDILPIMLDDMNNCSAFVDAFCGGCHVIENVPSSYRRIANDLNNYLITMWSMFVNTNLEFPFIISRESYNFYRNIFKKRGFNCKNTTSDDAMIGWVGYMASFNGRFFDGGYSGHDVKGRNYVSEQIRNILSQKDKLKSVEWNTGDYSDLEIPPKSLIYCDIPYKNTKQYLVSKDFDYKRFYEWCRKKKKEGHTVYVSEYDMPDDFQIVYRKNIKVSLSTKSAKISTEKLFKL